MLWRMLLSILLVLASAESGFVPLFNGRNFDGWEQRGNGAYSIEEGAIVAPPDASPLLYTEREYGDFTLRFEFRMAPGGNSGIGIRVPRGGHASRDGMEIQILDDGHPKYKAIRPEQFHGSVYGVIPARTGFLKPAGEWNQQEIRAAGRRITVTVNGVIVVDADLDIIKEPEVLKAHPGIARTAGQIGLLGHRSRVEFRNLRIRAE